MLKKLTIITLACALVLSLFNFTLFASEGPSDKSVYVKDGKIVNADIPLKGNNTKSVITGDALKIGFTGKDDPSIDIKLHNNIDTNTYKIVALKVKKTHDKEIGGELFYNEKDKGAVGEKLALINYTASTDWQWVLVDLGSVSAGNVGYFRFDMYGTAPTTDDLLFLAYVGFFKSKDDANAFAQSNEGKALGSNAGNDDFPFEAWFSKDGNITVGTWLNQHPENESGYFWTKFNANSKFNGVNFFIYAGDTPAEGKWRLYKYNANIDATLKGTPVASGDISTMGNTWLSALFTKQDAGQYVFYLEYVGGSHFVVANNEAPVGEGLIEFETKSNRSDETKKYMTGSILFEKNESGVYFNKIVADKELPPETNPKTGDITIVSYAAFTFLTVLLKKKKY